MPLVALGASKLTSDPTRIKASYTANHPLLSLPAAPSLFPSFFLSPPQVAISTPRIAISTPTIAMSTPTIAVSTMPRTAMSTPKTAMSPPPPCSPSLFSCFLRFAMSTPRSAMSTPRTAQVVFHFRQRPPYHDFLRSGSRFFPDFPALGLPL